MWNKGRPTYDSKTKIARGPGEKPMRRKKTGGKYNKLKIQEILLKLRIKDYTEFIKNELKIF